MSGPLRSKQGCWTCRLRKKKCDSILHADERRPRCSTCESLSITCYGFGPKPDWMDNGEKERAVANSLKDIVKQTSRRKVTIQFSKQRDPNVRIAPKPSNGSMENSSSDPGSSSQNGVTLPLDNGPSQEDEVNVLQDKSADPPSPEDSSYLMAQSISSSVDELVLLMHFLDVVFPLQYPMYKPEIQDGGRGWLLTLLLRTKPLYHAALALSAYHHRTTILTKISRPRQVATLIQQEKHLEICIKSVNQSAQNSCPKSGVGIMIAVTQLVFYELFTGHRNAWQPHLRAAMNMYDRCYKIDLTNLDLEERSRTVLLKNLSLSEYECESVVTAEVVNFRFLGCTLIWLDITFSITAGTTPHLLSYHACVIDSNSQTKLEDVMGCKNWVILQIGRIAALHEQTTQALRKGHFDCREFERTASNIGREIQCGLFQRPSEGVNISECDSATFKTTSDQPTLVTYIFACMAYIYLHLVTQGFQNMEMLDTIISEAMKILQSPISIPLLPALISPLYIIGSIARQEDEQFFRDMFSSPSLLGSSLQHRGRILPILEEIWSRRQTVPGFAWKDTLELSHDILLI